MKYPPIPSQLFIDNRQNLAAQLPADSFAVIHASDIPWLCADGSLGFIQHSDLFYLTGVPQEETVLILCPSHPDPEQREILFVRETSDLIKVWEGHKLTKDGATEVSGIATVEWTSRYDEVLRDMAQRYRHIYLNHNEHARSSSPMGTTRDDRSRQLLQQLYPSHRYSRLAPLITDLRQRKSPIEIALLERACQITEMGFRRVLSMVKPGVLEYEIEAEYAHEFLRHGSRGFAYQPIIASGVNGCVLHYLDNDQPCQDGDLLLMDVAAEFGYYNADMTRTIPVNGKFTPRQRAVYDAVLRIVRLCIDELITPGKNIRKEFAPEVARAVEDELIALGLLEQEKVDEERAQEDPVLPEEKRAYRKYFMHGVSHSLGIDVHDVLPANAEFVEDMFVTVEPGIYLPDEGFGIRLENDILVRADGNVDLMASIPIEADEIEALMASKK